MIGKLSCMRGLYIGVKDKPRDRELLTQRKNTWTGLMLKMMDVPTLEFLQSYCLEIVFVLICLIYEVQSQRG